MKLLIIDAQPGARRVIMQMLAPVPDLHFFEAGGVDEALAAFEKSRPDLLLLDTRLSAERGDTGGLEVLRRLRATGRRARAVVVSSSREFADVREAMRLGAQDYLAKDDLCAELLMSAVEAQRAQIGGG